MRACGEGCEGRSRRGRTETVFQGHQGFEIANVVGKENLISSYRYGKYRILGADRHFDGFESQECGQALSHRLVTIVIFGLYFIVLHATIFSVHSTAIITLQIGCDKFATKPGLCMIMELCDRDLHSSCKNTTSYKSPAIK